MASWAAGSSVSNLNDLSDVNAGSPSDGQVLKWNNSASEWQAAADNNSGGGGGGGSVGGSTGAVQFHDGSGFGGSSSLVWDNTLKRLGVGTGSPSYPLEIADGTPEVALEDTSSGGSFRLKLDGVGASINNYSNNGDLTFGTSGTGNFVFDTGNLGIGGSPTDGPLHIFNTHSGAQRTVTIENTGGGDAAIQYEATGGSVWASGLDNSDSDKFKISHNELGDVDRLTIDTAGNCGIGTSAPSRKLSISHDNAAAIAGLEVSNSTNTGDASAWFRTPASEWALGLDKSDSSNFKISNSSELGSNDKFILTTGGNLCLGAVTPNEKLDVHGSIRLSGSTRHVSFNSDDAKIVANSGSGGFSFYNGGSSGTERFNIGSDGVVSIKGGRLIIGEADVASGHIDSFENLTFNIDTDNDDTNRYFSFTYNASAGAGTEVLRIDEADGAITGGGLKLYGGILGHKDSDASSITLVGGSSSANSGANITLGGTSGSATREVIFKSNSTETMRIDSSGNLGIGGSPTDGPLHIFNTHSGAQRTVTIENTGGGDAAIQYEATGGSVWASGLDNSDSDKFKISHNELGDVDRLTIDTAGNCGIGTSAPSRKLSISHDNAAAIAGLEVSNSTNTGDASAWFRTPASEWALGLDKSDSSNFKISNSSELGSNDKFILTTGGNLCLGAVTPNEKLDVHGSIRLSGSTRHVSFNSDDAKIVANSGSGGFSFYNGGSSGTERFNIGSDGVVSIKGGRLIIGEADVASGHIDSFENLTFNIDTDNDDTNRYFSFTYNASAGAGTEVLRIDETGRVTVGNGSTITASGDADDLVIDKGAADTGLSILSTTTGRIYFGDAANEDAGSIRYVHSDDSMRFETDGTERMRIDSSGRLGIGTNSADEKLHVNSGATNTVALFESTDTEAAIQLKDTTGTAWLKCRNDYRFCNDSGELARIDSSGRLGIGTTSPSQKLHVNTNNVRIANGANGIEFQQQNSTNWSVSPVGTTTSFAVQGGLAVGAGYIATEAPSNGAIIQGSCGIGTTSPSASAKLHVAGKLLLDDSGDGYVYLGSDYDQYIKGDSGSNWMAFFTANTERLRIDSSGNIGLGTTSPTFSSGGGLHIKDASRANLRIETGSNRCEQFIDGLNFYLDHDPAGAIVFRNSTRTTRMVIASTGRVTVKKSSNAEVTALTDASSITPDFDDANNFSVTLGGNRTLANPSNCTAGQSGIITITQDGTGSRTLAYGAYWKFSGGTAPTLTTTASAVDVLAYYVESATRITATLISDTK